LRLLTRNWVTYSIGILFYVSIGVLFFWFRDQQPLKSRFVTPFVSFVIGGIALFTDFWQSRYLYEEYAKRSCVIIAYFGYTILQLLIVFPTLVMIRYTVLLRLYTIKKDFIQRKENLKKNVSSKINSKRKSIDISSGNVVSTSEDDGSQRSQSAFVSSFRRRLRQILLVIQSPYILIIFPVLWSATFATFVTVVLSANRFICDPTTIQIIRVVHIGGVATMAIIFSIFFVIDFIINIPNFVKCRWRKYIYQEDPFHFRSDYLVLIMFVPCVIFWALVPMPNLFYQIVNEILFFSGFCINGVMALFITMIKRAIFKIKSRGVKKKNLKLTLNKILQNENLLESFIEFCELEWSSENIYYKMDTEEYKKKNDLKSRRNLALQIRNNYLIRNVSPLEVNATGKNVNPVLKKIEEQDFTSNLFEKLDEEVEVNLCDTLSRFIISVQYNEYIRDNEQEIAKLGL
jgi:hypothetical protein